MSQTVRFSIYRYNPETDSEPYMQAFEIDEVAPDMMLLDALRGIKARDETLSFRWSCGEGVCGSDAMNVNGRNTLPCITPIEGLRQPIELRPLPAMPVIRDLVVDLSGFYRQYRAVDPYLIVNDPPPEVEFTQSPGERDRLDGLYECILCACCSTACPSFWWNPDKFLGPAALLQSYRFLVDSRDQASDERLRNMEGPYKLFRCHTIMSCTDVCPKGLNPTKAIVAIKDMMLKQLL